MSDTIHSLTKMHGAEELKFDYALLSDEIADMAMATAGRIKARLTRDYLATGRDLIDVKAKLNHGQFGDWLAAEFGLTARSAERYMAAARFESDNPDIVSHLLPETMKRLCSPTIPQTVRDDLVRLVKDGRSLQPTEITKAIFEFRDRKKKDSIAAKKSAAAKEKEAKSLAQKLKRHQKDMERAKREENERKAKLSPLARRIAEGVTKIDLSDMLEILTGNYHDKKLFLGLLGDMAEAS